MRFRLRSSEAKAKFKSGNEIMKKFFRTKEILAKRRELDKARKRTLRKIRQRELFNLSQTKALSSIDKLSEYLTAKV
jgi:hypothetical protein